MTLTGAHSVSGVLHSYGGDGGPGSMTNSGGRGGFGKASATVVGATASADVLVMGGNGGGADGAGHDGGDGGPVLASATVTGSGATTSSATASEYGGSGGSGANGANGGFGASVVMTSSVAGSTHGGTLELSQFATAGAGGASDGGVAGPAGNATCILTFDDTQNPTQCASVDALVAAVGGVRRACSGGGGSAEAPRVARPSARLQTSPATAP